MSEELIEKNVEIPKSDKMVFKMRSVLFDNSMSIITNAAVNERLGIIFLKQSFLIMMNMQGSVMLTRFCPEIKNEVIPISIHKIMTMGDPDEELYGLYKEVMYGYKQGITIH